MTVELPHAFEPDRFQREAFSGLDAGESVLVAAPTGSGKTVVAEYAVAAALNRGGRVFYTTPIKALSNQKYHDLVQWLGTERVGLLTGDNSVNGSAPVVVMTTEVLRNMIYGSGGQLDGLAYVVLDEVHYLQDAYRGPVWEEVIIHLPPSVRLVCLSATVSNSAELAAWISTVRGPTRVVVEHRRPVELSNLYLVGDRATERDHLIPVLVDGRPNREAFRFDVDPRQQHNGPHGRGPRRRFHTPRRLEVVERLADEGLLPAIYFIFSRAACSDAAAHLLDAGVRLTDVDERRRVRNIVEERVSALSDADLRVLGYDRFLAALEQGIAAHHAGMVPAFKEAVERCFAEGLVRVVFATETLALGINMPARTVVVERLSKFNGEQHEFLRPSQYTQLTGRAGRRGIDQRGHAVVLWSPLTPFDQVASLVASTEFSLTSAFRPTYNMAANLVRRYGPDEARHLLNLSFAQYQADRTVVGIERRLEDREAEIEGLRELQRRSSADVAGYVAQLDEVQRLRKRVPNARSAAEDGLSRLRPGDVIDIGPDREQDRLAVLSVAYRKKGSVRVRAVNSQADVITLGVDDFDQPPEPVAHVDLPVPFEPQRREFQQAAADVLRRANPRRGRRSPLPVAPGVEDYERALAALETHPLHLASDRDDLVAAHRRERVLERDAGALRSAVSRHADTLASRFERVLDLLTAWGFLDGWTLTPAGERLAGVYHEADLLIATAVEEGLLDRLDPAGMAGLVSCFVYEHRSPGPPPAPTFPSTELRRRYGQIERAWERLTSEERRRRLPETRAPDAGFVHLASAWASGSELHQLLVDQDLSGGDFVRNVKQLIDLLRQLGDLLPDVVAAASARQAADRLFRGVVSASSEIVPAGGVTVAGQSTADPTTKGSIAPGSVEAVPGVERADLGPGGEPGVEPDTDEAISVVRTTGGPGMSGPR